MHDDVPQWSKAIRDERKRRRWSVPQLARLLIADARKTGEIPPTFDSLIRKIYRWEAGKNFPDETSRWRLAAVFGVSERHLQFNVDASQVALVSTSDDGTARIVPATTTAQLVYGQQATHDYSPSSPHAPRDWTAWFSYRLAQLISVIDQWQSPVPNAIELQRIVHQEILMFDATEPDDSTGDYKLSRRQALVTLAFLPVTLCTTIRLESESSSLVEKFVAGCSASITACWHLLRGSDLAIVEETISSYVLNLTVIARQPSSHQLAAAELSSQAYRMLGILALHHGEMKARQKYFSEALRYAEIAADPRTQASALISLGSTPLLYSNDPRKAAATYEQALVHENQILPLQRVRIYAELSMAYGQQGREQEALRYLGLAEEGYPDDPENDPSFLYADFTRSSFILDRGLTYLALSRNHPDRGYQKRAWDTFDEIGKMQGLTIPQRILVEITNQQAMTAVEMRELDLFVAYVARGVDGATQLQSDQRHREARDAWSQAMTVWPTERRVKQLADVFAPALTEHN